MKLDILLEKRQPGEYLGPKEFGANPEHGGSKAQGVNRMQAMKNTKDERLTPAVKARVTELFKGYAIDIKKIDKTRKGYLRISYNKTDSGKPLHHPYPPLKD